MRILICGDRSVTDASKIKARMEMLAGIDPNAEIIVGGAPGVDALAERAALDEGLDVITIHANWCRHGKYAGPRRNLKMLGMKPDLVIAFHADLHKSKGTAHTVAEARDRGIKVEILNP